MTTLTILNKQCKYLSQNSFSFTMPIPWSNINVVNTTFYCMMNNSDWLCIICFSKYTSKWWCPCSKKKKYAYISYTYACIAAKIIISSLAWINIWTAAKLFNFIHKVNARSSEDKWQSPVHIFTKVFQLIFGLFGINRHS